MNTLPAAHDLQFGDWHYRVDRRLLSRPGVSRQLKPLLDRLLRRLLAEPGRVIDRHTLLEEVWTRRAVNDEVLSRAMAELRALLDDDARQPRYIETVAKGGYRWLTNVDAVSGRTASGVQMPTPSASVPARAGHRRLAGLALLVLLGLLVWTALRRQEGEQPAASSSVVVDLLQARPLAAAPALELEPRFDRSGRVALVRSHEQRSELLLLDRDGAGERVLWQVDGWLRHPTPSPDLRQIAIVRLDASACAVWSIDTLDGRARRLTECAWLDAGLEWVDNGGALLFTAPLSAGGGLARWQADDGSVQQLTRPETAERAHVHPRLSFDGRRLVYAALVGSERQAWLVDWPGLQQRQAVLARPEPLHGQAWHPDGSLWLAGDLLRYRALHRWSPEQPLQLLGGRGARALDIAADGAVVWSESRVDADVWIRTRSGDRWRAVATSTHHESQPVWSHDGRRLALVSNRLGSEAVLLVDTDAADRVSSLPLEASLRWVRPSWSRDDSALILTAYSGEHTRLLRLELSTGALRNLTDPQENAFAGVELERGLLYRHGEAGVGRLRLRTDEGQVVDLPIGPVTEFRANDDWLVWQAPGSDAVQVASTTDWQLRQTLPAVTTGFALVGPVLWRAEAAELQGLDLGSGQSHRLALPQAPDRSPLAIAISLSGGVAYSRTTRVEMDLMIALPGQ